MIMVTAKVVAHLLRCSQQHAQTALSYTAGVSQYSNQRVFEEYPNASTSNQVQTPKIRILFE
jgi:hypothetical protein